MPARHLKSDALLLLSATIWGFAFVAQRVGMDHVGPFTFNGIRFLLGALVLVPFMRRKREPDLGISDVNSSASPKNIIVFGGLTGIALFGGASLQQVGLVYTTAGKAGFITGLYVVIVPIMGLLWGQRTNAGTWIGALLAALGLYLLSITRGFSIAFGDLLELIGALLWAVQIHLIGWLSPRTDSLRLAFVQFMVCAAASLVTAALFESATAADIAAAAIPIIYGGVLSVGIAFTLQVVAQRSAHPAHAAVLFSLESVFAAVGGWLILGEVMSDRAMAGCALMFAGMLISQLFELVKAGGRKYFPHFACLCVRLRHYLHRHI
jgi:drug/metabolite transporter (DMT)-like permease